MPLPHGAHTYCLPSAPYRAQPGTGPIEGLGAPRSRYRTHPDAKFLAWRRFIYYPGGTSRGAAAGLNKSRQQQQMFLVFCLFIFLVFFLGGGYWFFCFLGFFLKKKEEGCARIEQVSQGSQIMRSDCWTFSV